MTSEDRVEDRRQAALPEHPVRVALLDLLAQVGTITSTRAAERLGYSSGLCSFHLRRLAGAGLIEEAPTTDGRARPWRLRWNLPEHAPEPPGLPDYQRWLEHRAAAPARWRHDEAVTTVVNLTPGEMRELAEGFKALVATYEAKGKRRGMKPVAVVARVFPLVEDR